MARAGLFIPNGNSDRSHRGTTLLGLLVAGAGGADVMLEGPGHWCVKAVTNAAYCSRHAKQDLFGYDHLTNVFLWDLLGTALPPPHHG